MKNCTNICILIDETILTVHHGVRRYLMALSGSLTESGNKVTLIDVTNPTSHRIIGQNRRLMVDNGFSGNRLIGSTKEQILKFLLTGGFTEMLANGNPKVDVSFSEENETIKIYDVCIVGAPWVIAPYFNPPKANVYKCIAYDAIPNLYYFNNPDDCGLHLFANAHSRGYEWADNVGNGIYCISEETAHQCKMFGFGRKNNLAVIPPLLPPGFSGINAAFDNVERGRVAILAAPFDRRKGLLLMPELINAGEFDSLIIFGRPRCSFDDIKNFFNQIKVNNIEWWCDVDFKKQVELYTRSKVLIFPSLNEGLGFPVLEAYSCGVSVLASNISPLNKLVLNEDLLSVDYEHSLIQVKDRASAKIDPDKYRHYVHALCSSAASGII